LITLYTGPVLCWDILATAMMGFSSLKNEEICMGKDTSASYKKKDLNNTSI
jgi:hypothetical protein